MTADILPLARHNSETLFIGFVTKGLSHLFKTGDRTILRRLSLCLYNFQSMKTMDEDLFEQIETTLEALVYLESGNTDNINWFHSQIQDLLEETELELKFIQLST